MSDWNPSLYLQYGAERTRPAAELLARVPLDAVTTVIDLGCGPGNSTALLKQRWPSAHITGVDNSPAMLEEARRNSAGRQIDYVLSDDALSRVEGTYDFVNSCIVLQHIPVDRGMNLLGQLLGRVRPGGGCLIQLSTKRNHGKWRELRYRIRHAVPGGQAVMNLIDGRAADTPVMQMNEYPLDAVLRLFHENGFEKMVVRYEDHGGTDTAMIFARRD